MLKILNSLYFTKKAKKEKDAKDAVETFISEGFGYTRHFFFIKMSSQIVLLNILNWSRLLELNLCKIYLTDFDRTFTNRKKG